MSVNVEPSFSEHLRVLWRARWWALGAALLVAAGVWVVRSAAERSFEATALVRLVVRNGDGLVIDQSGATLLSQTYAQVASGARIQSAGASTAGLTVASDHLARLVRARAGNTPGFVEIRAVGPTEARARALADGVASALAEAVAAEQLAESAVRVEASVEGSGPDSTVALGPSALGETAVSFLVVALVVAEGFALVRSVRGALPLGDPDVAVRALIGVDCIAVDIADRDRAVQLLVPLVPALGPVVTVVQRGEPGSAAGALLLADAAGAAGRRAVLVDTDLSAPLFDDAPGLTEVAVGLVAPVAVALRSPDSPTPILSAGRRGAARPGEQLGPNLGALLQSFGVEHVIVSTTSASTASESSLVVGRLPECVVLVLDPDRTTRRRVRATADELGARGASLRAVVLVAGGDRVRLGLPEDHFEPALPWMPYGLDPASTGPDAASAHPHRDPRTGDARW
jgi:hypothetical protein